MTTLYEANPVQGPLSWIVSRVTLLALFGTTLFYWIIVPVAIYLIYTFQTWIGATLLFILLASPWWPGTTHWPAFASSYGFDTWRSYFSFKVIQHGNVQLPDGAIYVAVPHGLFPMALPMMAGVWSKCFPLHKQTPVAAIASSLFYVPLLSPMLRWLGCIPATKEAMTRTLEVGQSVFLLPDGIAGAFCSDRGREVLYIRKRYGFVKLAHATGKPIVPVYVTGHTQLFDLITGPDSFFARLSRMVGFSIILYRNMLPYRSPVTLVMGEPIELRKSVEETHAVFLERIQLLYSGGSTLVLV